MRESRRGRGMRRREGEEEERRRTHLKDRTGERRREADSKGEYKGKK